MAAEDLGGTKPQAEQWRAEHRIIDLHQHVDYTTQHLARAVRIMDAAGVGLAVDLDGGTVTRGREGAASAFARNKALADALHPGRFLHYMHLDYTGWDEPGWSERAANQIDEGRRLGAAGLKEFKRLGLFLKHQDRILFGTDFMVYDRLIMGSSGNEPPPTDAEAEVFYAKEWRWLETRDPHWEHMTPIQGDWTISSIGLPAPVLRKIYFDNARKLLARSLPLPTGYARKISQEIKLDGRLDKPGWQTARPVRLEYAMQDGAARPDLFTTVRFLWSDQSLYLAFECPYTRLTVFEPRRAEGKRFDLRQAGVSLWDRDVVEAFIGTDPKQIRRYTEFEIAPTNERLDLMIPHLPEKDFAWNSGFQSAVKVDPKAKVWTCEVRIPLPALSDTKPVTGTRWRLNLFRSDRAHHAFLAWSPTLTGSTHVPEQFGVLEFGD